MLNNWHKKEKPLLSMSGLGGGSFREVLANVAALGESRSLRFNSGDSSYFSRTPSSGGNRKTFTFSFWVKRTSFASSQKVIGNENASEQNGLVIEFRSDDTLQVYDYTTGTIWAKVTTRAFRDPSAWYHFVIAVDTTQSTPSDRFKLYVNGIQETSFSTDNAITEDADTQFNDAGAMSVGRSGLHDAQYFNGFLTDIYFIDGSALDHTSFGSFDSNGVWQRSLYDGSYGTNGFKLNFFDATNTTTIGKDASGRSNNFTANNISVTAGVTNDVMFDMPANDTENSDTGVGGEIIGNYCILNTLGKKASGTTISNGSLDGVVNADNTAHGTFAIPTTGKYFFEAQMTNSGTLNFGLAAFRPDGHIFTNPNSCVYSKTGVKNVDNVHDQSYGDSWSSGDIIGCACDADAGTITFYKNGVSQGAISHQVAGLLPSFGNGGTTSNFTVNFGAREFIHPISNHKALNTSSLPTPAIADGSDAFEVKLYSGTGAVQNVTGLSFQPDWTWIKARNQTTWNVWNDVVRGPGKNIHSNDSYQEQTKTDNLTSFNSDGFSLGVDSNADGVNISGKNYASWNWKVGGAAVTNTEGATSCSVSASTTNGISIIKWAGTNSGTTLGHGLSSTPELVIVKSLGNSREWVVWHKLFVTAGGTDYLYLDTTGAKGGSGSGGYWNSTVPNSTTISVGDSAAVNGSGSDNVAYCFHSVPSFSAVGSYKGNGSEDGPYINLSFKPRWILMKNADTGGTYYDWRIIDAARHTFNSGGNADVPPTLFANTNETERDWDNVDILSNGFKIKDSSVSLNETNASHVFLAFAENPFQANGGLAR